MFFWILTTTLLLKNAGPVTLKDLLLEVPATYLTAVAGVISGILLLELCEKTSTGTVIWVVLWFIFPKALLYLGIRFPSLYQAALWIPTNLFSVINNNHVNMSECITAWDTANGMFRCILSGSAGVVLFSLIGILAKISTILAEHRIGIFAISTFNTDYILVKQENFAKAVDKAARLC